MTSAVIVGAGGGIGRALVTSLLTTGGHDQVHALSRRGTADPDPRVCSGTIDITEEDTIRSAATRVGTDIDLVVVATGILHEDGLQPERALRELDPARLARIFAINTIGPALVLKHFVPLLARDRRAVVAVLSARVGSISDNRSGGWYGYRASKAALNMIVRSAAIELSRTRAESICVGLHPGTVDTGLSKPFQARVLPERLFRPDFAAARLLDVIGGLTSAETGRCFAWDATEILP